jgi:hypothetical protein
LLSPSPRHAADMITIDAFFASYFHAIIDFRQLMVFDCRR